MWMNLLRVFVITTANGPDGHPYSDGENALRFSLQSDHSIILPYLNHPGTFLPTEPEHQIQAISNQINRITLITFMR
jgi:hypothetical protein